MRVKADTATEGGWRFMAAGRKCEEDSWISLGKNKSASNEAGSEEKVRGRLLDFARRKKKRK